MTITTMHAPGCSMSDIGAGSSDLGDYLKDLGEAGDELREKITEERGAKTTVLLTETMTDRAENFLTAMLRGLVQRDPSLSTDLKMYLDAAMTGVNVGIMMAMQVLAEQELISEDNFAQLIKDVEGGLGDQ